MRTRDRGQIVRLFRDRGFGFIRRIDGEEVFFGIQSFGGFANRGEFDSLRGDEEVTFETRPDNRGRPWPRAWNVEVIE